MVRTRHSHETEKFPSEEFTSANGRSKQTDKFVKDREDGSDDSGVIQFRQTRTRGKQEMGVEIDTEPRTRRAAAKRVSYVEDCIDEDQNGDDFMYSSRRLSRKRVVSEDDDSAVDTREDESPKQAAKYNGDLSPRRGRSAKSPVTEEKVPRSCRKTSDYLVAHPSPSRQLKQEQLDELEEAGTRRSLRQRRQLYGTLNEKHLDSAINYEEIGQRRKRRRLENEEDNEEGEKHDGEPDEEGFTDMYSRVKRKRKNVKRDMYGMPIEGSSEEEEEDSDDSDDSSEEDSDEEEEDGDDDENEKDEEGEGEKESGPKSYFLRKNKPRTQLYNAPIEGPKRRRNMFHDETPHSPVRRKRRGKLASMSYMSPARRSYMSPARRKHGRKRTAFHGSSSSTSSSESSSDEERFQRRKAKSMMKARNRCLPMNFDKDDFAGSSILRDRQRIGASLADVDPMKIDRSVTFQSVGGLGKHIQALKEMVVFPLLYPEIFERFKINPPRGVLFYGPPGTGKTLVARALSNECSTGERKVAFYMRKGADCLSKWVGESERQLRLLFDQAYQTRPSIIFFDEIDGLAPVRSSRQDQIHSSIVSTLLALMDGLDSRGEIVVIGATNRIDSIDPALRRPGRFDREFLFPLPSLSARSQILKINTKEWNPKLSDNFVAEVAEKCVGYCGADLRALCTEAALLALRRRYPQIYTASEKLQIDVASINVSAKDFFYGTRNIVPTAQRSVTSPGRALSLKMSPLLQTILTEILEALNEIFPSVLSQLSSLDAPETAEGELESDEDGDQLSIYEQKNRRRKNNAQQQTDEGKLLSFANYAYQHPSTNRPRLLLTGRGDQGQTSHIGPAILHHLEQLPVHTLDLPTLFAVSARTPEESCAQIFREARRTSPSIVYLPHINQWWNVLGDTVRTTFLTLVQDLDPSSPLLLLATSEEKYEELDYSLQDMFENFAGEVISMRNPTEDERRNFFKDLLLSQATRPPPQRKVAAERILEVLPVAPAPEPRQLTERELAKLRDEEEAHLRELRLFLRDVLNKLGQDRKFGIFTKPVEIEDVPDYYDIIKKPMDLSTMMSKIDLHHYQCVREFMDDIDQICANALEYNPDRDPQSRVIRHRACALRDTAYAITKAELDPEFEKTCLDIVESRKGRGEDGTTTAPQYYHTRPLNTGPFHPLAITRHPPSSTSNPVTLSPVRTSRRLHGASVDELPPLEEVERKARMVRRLLREQNSPKKENSQENSNSESSNRRDPSLSKSDSGLKSDSVLKPNSGLKSSSSSNRFALKRNMSSSLAKNKVKKSIWDASRYGSRRRRRKRRQISMDEGEAVENNLDNDEIDSDNRESDNEKIEEIVNGVDDSQNASNCEKLSDMDTASPLQAGVRSPRTRHRSGGMSSENKDHEGRSSRKNSLSNCLSVDVDMNCHKDGQRSPRIDSQVSSQRSPRSDSQRSPAWTDTQRSPGRLDVRRSPARSESQRASRIELDQSTHRSPHSDHEYSRQCDQENTGTLESPQRSYRPSSGQRSRSPRQSSGGRSPRGQDSECSRHKNIDTDSAIDINKITSSSETAQNTKLQGIPQESVSQDKTVAQDVDTELITCDSGIGSSESSNDSIGKAKEMLKAHEAQHEEMLKDANKPSTSGTSSKETCDKTTDNEEENTQEDMSPKFRVTRARIQSRSQQKALEILQESTQQVTVDRERLVRLLDTAVELTKDYSVSRLEKLHTIFSQCIYQHRLEFDKTQLVQEMEQKLQQFTSHINRQKNIPMITDT